MILTVTLNAAIDKRYVVTQCEWGEVNRVTKCKYSAGGKGLNVSRVAAIAGERVIATGFLGGHAGAYIQEEIMKQGVISEFVQVRGESRSCINIYDEKNKQQTEFLEPGLIITSEEEEYMFKKYKRLLQVCDVVAISGSMPKGASEELYGKMIQSAKDAGKKVLLDTSGRLLEVSLGAKPTLIKPNKDEIGTLIGKVPDTVNDCIVAAQKLQQTGIEIVVISLGGEGAIVACKEGIYQVTVPKIEVVNTVGCGDAMIAGFAIGISRKLPIEEIIRLASAISVASAKQEETGVFAQADLSDLLSQIHILKVGGSLNESLCRS